MEREAAIVIGALGVALRPRGSRLFSGVVRKDHLSRRGRAQFRLMAGRYGDYRDWAQIDAWAEGIADELVAAAPDTEPV
jgi:menaquinone-dependent protoporphyrinogen oxidase